MGFPRLTTAFGRKANHVALESPYARAAAEWDDRMGSARVQAKNWRILAVGTLIWGLLATVGLVYTAMNKQVATYVVEVDKAGMPGQISLASVQYKPDIATTGYFVGEVVRLARGKPIDPVVKRKQWEKVYHFVAGDAIRAMNEYAASDSGLENIPGRGAEARTVEVISILQKSADTYQVRWIERSFFSGVKRGQESWTGLFTVSDQPPRTTEDSFNNPIGVYVSNYTWSREFGGPVASDIRELPKREPAKRTDDQKTE